MQNATPFSLSTLAYILGLVAVFVTNILTALVTNRFTKSQQIANARKTNAETGKTEAQQRQIDSEIVLHAFERIEELVEINRVQTGEAIALQRAKAEVEWKLSLSEQREKIHLEELSLAQAELEMLRPPKQPFEPIEPIAKQR